MACDKLKAKRKKWRIKESKIFLIAFIGGAFGVYTGLKIFKHKTLHKKFSIGIPVLILLNLIIFYWVYLMKK